MKEIYVNAYEYVEITSEPDEDDEWSRGNTYTQWTIDDKIYLSQPYAYREKVSLEFDVEVGKTYYLLYAIYSTGDSFGHDENRQIDFIDLFTSYDKADAAKKALDVPLYQTVDYTRHYTNEVGTVINYLSPWDGYFESLGYIEIEGVTAKP